LEGLSEDYLFFENIGWNMSTYGMISSCRPLRNKMGIFVIFVIVSSVGQIWWQRGARKRAGGNALQKLAWHASPAS
jgi:hypothetical protein